jgi:hypothetical protein
MDSRSLRLSFLDYKVGRKLENIKGAEKEFTIANFLK